MQFLHKKPFKKGSYLVRHLKKTHQVTQEQLKDHWLCRAVKVEKVPAEVPITELELQYVDLEPV